MELTSSTVSAAGSAGLPPGFKGPRGRILVELKRAPGLAAKDLSARLSLSLNAIRHHLKELETEGVIGYQREQRGVGAPAFAYRLNEAGEALFPRRYAQALTDVLDAVVRREGRAAAVAVLQSHYADLAQRLEGELTDATPQERVEAVTRVLVDEGFMAEWDEAADGSGMLREHNCAILAVAERFPEICAAEGKFLEDVLAAVVDRRSHMLTGCGSCEYHVQFAELGGPTGTPASVSHTNRGPAGSPEERA